MGLLVTVQPRLKILGLCAVRAEVCVVADIIRVLMGFDVKVEPGCGKSVVRVSVRAGVRRRGREAA